MSKHSRLKIDQKFIMLVRNEIKKLRIPPYPWALGFHKELFERLKKKKIFEGRLTRLRVTVKRYCRWHCNRAPYLKAVATGKPRRHLDWKKEFVSRKHRAYSNKKLSALSRKKPGKPKYKFRPKPKKRPDKQYKIGKRDVIVSYR